MTLGLEDVVQMLQGQLTLAFAVFLRLSAFFSLLPAFGERSVPTRVKLVLAVAMTLVVAPAIQPVPDLSRPVLLIFSEVTTGLVLGLALRLFILALQTAGAIAAQATGAEICVAEGSMGLYDGVATGIDEALRFLDPYAVNRVILLSDGLANVGPTSPDEIAALARDAAAAEMTEAILKDNKRVLPCAAYCDGEYDLHDLFIGVPVKLGAGGVEEIIEVDLDADERDQLDTSAEHVHSNLDDLERLREAGKIG